MVDQLHAVYEIQKMLLGTPTTLAFGTDSKARIGALVADSSENKKVYQQLRQPDVRSAKIELAIAENQKSLKIPSYIFLPMVRNVVYIYEIKVMTALDYNKGNFKFVFPDQIKEKFNTTIVLVKDEKTGSMHEYNFQFIIRRNNKGNTTEYFTNFMARDQVKIMCASRPAAMKLSITSYQVVFGPLPSPCLLDIVVDLNGRRVAGRFNADSYHMLKPYFKTIRTKFFMQLQNLRANKAFYVKDV